MVETRPRRSPAIAILIGFIALSSAGTATAQEPVNTARPPVVKPAQIDRNGVLILLRTTLLALDDADKTGNYTTFRDLAAPGLATTNTAAKLGDIFAGNRRDGLDLSGVAVLDPQLTVLPEIEANGMMRMAGFFPSVPKQVNFELLYQPVNGQWRLFGISVNVGPSGPVAPTSQPPAPAPVSMAPKSTKQSQDKRRPVNARKPVAAHGEAPADSATPPSEAPKRQ